MSDFTDVIANGSHREKMLALRDFLAHKLEEAKYTKDYAPLAAQLRQVLIDLDAMPVEGGESVLDELAKQRALRQANATTSQRTAV